MRLTQHALDDQNEFSAHHLRLRLRGDAHPSDNINGSVPGEIFANDYNLDVHDDRTRTEEDALTVRLETDNTLTSAKAELQDHSRLLNILHPGHLVPSIAASTSSLSGYIATKLQELFYEEQGTIEYILTSSHTFSSQSAHQSSSASRDSRPRNSRMVHPELAAKLASRMTRSVQYAPTYHLTFSLFTPAATPSNWEIESAIVENLSPLLDALSVVSNFTVDTQVQLHAKFAPSVHPPEFDETAGVWTLRDEDLSGFVNAAEWPLSPSIGEGSTLNFILYVPESRHTPLVVKSNHASNWLVPQWGGVSILNLADEDGNSRGKTLSKAMIQPPLLIFSHQLLSLLGAPQTPQSLPLQLQTLTRARAASLLLSASATMGSLARLTVALPSIAIPETVSTAVESTLDHLRSTCTALKAGHFQQALNHARIAEAQAERGFFEKSMVGQVYFPDEHKVAVYLPLLGPIGVPLFMNALKEVRKAVAARRAKRSIG